MWQMLHAKYELCRSISLQFPFLKEPHNVHTFCAFIVIGIYFYAFTDMQDGKITFSYEKNFALH